MLAALLKAVMNYSALNENRDVVLELPRSSTIVPQTAPIHAANKTLMSGIIKQHIIGGYF